MLCFVCRSSEKRRSPSRGGAIRSPSGCGLLGMPPRSAPRVRQCQSGPPSSFMWPDQFFAPRAGTPRWNAAVERRAGTPRWNAPWSRRPLAGETRQGDREGNGRSQQTPLHQWRGAPLPLFPPLEYLSGGVPARLDGLIERPRCPAVLRAPSPAGPASLLRVRGGGRAAASSAKHARHARAGAFAAPQGWRCFRFPAACSGAAPFPRPRAPPLFFRRWPFPPECRLRNPLNQCHPAAFTGSVSRTPRARQAPRATRFEGPCRRKLVLPPVAEWRIQPHHFMPC